MKNKKSYKLIIFNQFDLTCEEYDTGLVSREDAEKQLKENIKGYKESFPDDSFRGYVYKQ